MTQKQDRAGSVLPQPVGKSERKVERDKLIIFIITCFNISFVITLHCFTGTMQHFGSMGVES